MQEQEEDSSRPALKCHEIIPSCCCFNPDSLVNKSCAKKQICSGEGNPDAFRRGTVLLAL